MAISVQFRRKMAAQKIVLFIGCFSFVKSQSCGVGTGNVHLHLTNSSDGKGLLEERIVGGFTTQPNEWPWQASLRIHNPQTGQMQHWCGGVLIGRQHIVTAAHCVKNAFGDPRPSSWQAVLGDHHLHSVDRGEKTIQVATISYYPWFTQFDYDIAVMKLSKSVEFNKYIQPACLPAPGMSFVGMMCVATGWGKLSGDGTSAANTLQKVHLQIYDNSVCGKAYMRQFQIKISKWHICAGSHHEMKGTCQGDSGGPLQCKYQNRWYVIGLTSFGAGCARQGYPDVFTKTSYFSTWISRQSLLL